MLHYLHDQITQTDSGECRTIFKSLISGGEEDAAKLQHLHELCTKLHLSPTDCIVVGDGANDVPLFTATGCGVTFSDAKPNVRAAAAHTIDSLHDLPHLLHTMCAA